ncbi:unnamed protein product [Mytilus coruscus]|uniref:Uncharacterized protein n=1 Tax=Mytilus coruscus TaxID=42192 RepID=A0A6J8EDY4_MYTCO|nr:unnamed protein product [Mytilus coruscus]
MERPGHKVVINGNNFDTTQCLSDRYQPFRFITTQGSDCEFKKEMCNSEGQVVYNNGSVQRDRRCRCDHTKGYSFVKSPKSPRKDVCSCNPTFQDCSCYLTRCRKGYILSPDLPKTELLKVYIGALSCIFVLLGVFGVFYCCNRQVKDISSQPEKVISNIIPTGTNHTKPDVIEMDESLYETIDESKLHTVRIHTVNNSTLGLNEDVYSSTDDDDDRSSYLNPYNSLLKEPSDYHTYEKI